MESNKPVPATFAMDNLLPSLPLPSLESTLKKYLEAIKPFVDRNEYMRTESIVEKFQNGIGSRLDFILREKARNERNWVSKIFFFKLS